MSEHERLSGGERNRQDEYQRVQRQARAAGLSKLEAREVAWSAVYGHGEGVLSADSRTLAEVVA